MKATTMEHLTTTYNKGCRNRGVCHSSGYWVKAKIPHDHRMHKSTTNALRISRSPLSEGRTGAPKWRERERWGGLFIRYACHGASKSAEVVMLGSTSAFGSRTFKAQSEQWITIECIPSKYKLQIHVLMLSAEKLEQGRGIAFARSHENYVLHEWVRVPHSIP